MSLTVAFSRLYVIVNPPTIQAIMNLINDWYEILFSWNFLNLSFFSIEATTQPNTAGDVVSVVTTATTPQSEFPQNYDKSPVTSVSKLKVGFL